MRLLVVKTSSLGDVIHTLAALSDAAQRVPGLRVDWLVEEAFAEIPAWHPAVERVIPVALRRWRRAPWRAGAEWRDFLRKLRAVDYDRVVDAQGLVKSALLTRLARGPRHGLDRASAREPLAALAYQYRHGVPWGQHSVARLRRLFALALDYPEPREPADFGVDRHRFEWDEPGPYVVFLHGTSWPSKHYPEDAWLRLGQLANADGYRVLLFQGSAAEAQRASRLAGELDDARVLPPAKLGAVAAVLAGASGVVGVDTGLAQLAAALGVSGVTLFGATSPTLTGPLGPAQENLQAVFHCAPCLRRHCRYPASTTPGWPPCYAGLEPPRIWARLRQYLPAGDPSRVTLP